MIEIAFQSVSLVTCSYKDHLAIQECQDRPIAVHPGFSLAFVPFQSGYRPFVPVPMLAVGVKDVHEDHVKVDGYGVCNVSSNAILPLCV